jgi:hypothetical protein
MSAFVVAAIDEKPGWSRRPHFAESDFLFTHASLRHWSMAYQSAGGPASASRYSLRLGTGVDLRRFTAKRNPEERRERHPKLDLWPTQQLLVDIGRKSLLLLRERDNFMPLPLDIDQVYRYVARTR